MITIPLFFYLLQTPPPPGLASSSGCPTPTSSACPSCTGWRTWPRSAQSSPPWPSAWRGTLQSASRCGSGEETRFFAHAHFPPQNGMITCCKIDLTIYCTWSWLVPVSYYFSLPLWKTRSIYRRTKCDKVAFQTDCRHLALKRRSRNQIDVSWAISLSAHSSRCLTYSSLLLLSRW